MRPVYGCVCFALPKKLIQHLADTSDGEHSDMLKAQIAHSSGLRGRRAQHTVKGVAPKPGVKPLQRSVFDAGGRTLLPGKLLRDEDDPPTKDKLADEAYDTVAGLVTAHFGRLPRRGEFAVLEGYEFRVLRADRRRVEALRVTVPQSGDTAPDAVAATRKSG